jgi:violaxanthin de-epoxidase
VQTAAASVALTTALIGLALFTTVLPSTAAWAAPDSSSKSTDIVGCLFQKCSASLAKCVANPKCLANVVCINTCTGRPDEIDCQIKCGDLFENSVVGEFNKCVVSDMSCVPQQPDSGAYPVPAKDQVVSDFKTKLFNGRWYISAGA